MKPKPIELTLRGVYEANIKAIREHKLGALAGKDSCRYDYGDGCGCAIGVALPKGQLAKWPESLISERGRFMETQQVTLDGLRKKKLVTIDPAHEGLLLDLQRAHDGWIGGGRSRKDYDFAMHAIALALGEIYNEA